MPILLNRKKKQGEVVDKPLAEFAQEVEENPIGNVVLSSRTGSRVKNALLSIEDYVSEQKKRRAEQLKGKILKTKNKKDDNFKKIL